MPDTSPSACKCGCGQPARGPSGYARGHWRRAPTDAAEVPEIPGPDDIEDFTGSDAIIDIGSVASNPPDPDPEAAGPVPQAPSAGPAAEDRPPAHATREWRKKRAKASTGSKAKPGPPRVTVGVRNDIHAKVAFALEIPGRVWAARDPVCGGTFVEQAPEISAALTDIVCQSPDLIEWFTGQGGAFMLWLNCAAACWPVVTVIMAHHVYHTVASGHPEDYQPGFGPAQQPDYSRYAA